jgi:Protein of unknown function (DUF1565)
VAAEPQVWPLPPGPEAGQMYRWAQLLIERMRRYLAANTREILTSDRTYYVSTTGQDTADGLTAPFRTIQKAIDTVAQLDLSIFNAIIQCASGTYTSGAVVRGPFVGFGRVILRGNLATPSLCFINSAESGVICENGGSIDVEGFRISAVNYAFYALALGFVRVTGPIELGTADVHFIVDATASIRVRSNITIVAGAAYFVVVFGGYFGFLPGITITFVSTPAFAAAVVFTDRGGLAEMVSVTFVGSATGVRFAALSNGVIFTNTSNVNFIPGSVAGFELTGGRYT